MVTVSSAAATPTRNASFPLRFRIASSLWLTPLLLEIADVVVGTVKWEERRESDETLFRSYGNVNFSNCLVVS